MTVFSGRPEWRVSQDDPVALRQRLPEIPLEVDRGHQAPLRFESAFVAIALQALERLIHRRKIDEVHGYTSFKTPSVSQ